MGSRYDVELMVKVAQMYYLNNLKQDEIAKELQLSRSTISMIIAEAKEVGIVEINVRNPLLSDTELETEIKELYPRTDCTVVQTAVQDPAMRRKLVAQRAIDVFNRAVDNHFTIGVSWGRHVYEFISQYQPSNVWRGLSIVPLVGGSKQRAPYFQLNEMVRLLAEKIGATPYFIHAPEIASTVEEKELFLNSAYMQEIVEKWQDIDLSITGIGAIPDLSDMDREVYLGEVEMVRELESKGAVGDICVRYFDIHGGLIDLDYYDRIIGIPYEGLRRIKNVMCVASGLDKTYAILAALRSGTMNTLVSDGQTAKSVVELNRLLGTAGLALPNHARTETT